MTDYDDAVLFDAPMLYWKLAADANDYSGNARHGTVTGGTWTFGQTPPAPQLVAGSKAPGSAFIASPSWAVPAGTLTIEMWFEVILNSTMPWGWQTGRFDMWTSGGLTYNDGSNNATIPGTSTLSGIHHLVWVFTQNSPLTGVGSKFYLDGVLQTSLGGGFTPPVQGTSAIKISGWFFDTNYRLVAGQYVSHFAVYAGELAASRIADHYLSASSPAISNNFADLRTPITGAVAKTAITTAFTTEASEPLGNGPALNTGWSTLVPAATGVYQVDTIGSSYNTALAIYTGSALGSLTLLGADDSSGGAGNAKIAVFLIAGTTYYIQTGGAGGATGGALNLNVSLVASSLADNFLAGGLISLGLLASSASNPNSTTLVPQPPAETVIPGCDHQVIPGASVALAWDLQSSQNAGGSGKVVTYRLRRDNLAGAVLASISKNATVDSVGGNDTGMAWASSYSDVAPTTGHYVLTSQATGVATTNYMAKSVFTTTGAVPSTTGFTTEPGEPLTMPIAATGWVRFQPTLSGYYQFDTIGSAFDTGLAVYSGTVLTGLTLLASDNNSGGSGTSKLVVHLTAGVIYPVQVGSGSGTAAGTLSLTAAAAGYDTSLPPEPTLAGGYGTITASLLKGRSNQANDALAGG